MRRFIDTAGYYVTDEPSFMEKEHAMTEELSEKLQEFHMDVVKGKKGTADRLIKLIGKNPRNPQVKNLLTSYYLVIGEPEKAYASNRKTIEAHPDYFFGKLNLAQEHIYNNEHEKIIEVLGENFDLVKIYPERDTFHVSEAMGILKFAVIYFSHIKEFEKAGAFIEQMKEIDEDDFEVENAEKILFAEVLNQVAVKSIEEAENSIDVEVPEQKVTTKMQKPKYNHPEIELLYQQDISISDESLDKILNLPRTTLIQDLVTVLKDGINRFSFFEEQEWNHGSSSFVLHAFNLLAELEAVEEFPVVLNILRQSEDFLEFFFGDFLTEYAWISIYKLGSNQSKMLEDFMKEPGVYTYSKSEVSRVLFKILQYFPERREEMIQCYSAIFNYYINAEIEDNVIDSNLIGLMIADLMEVRGIELLPLITELFALNFVSTRICGSLEDVEYHIRNSPINRDKFEVLTVKEMYHEIATTWASYNADANDEFDTDVAESKNSFLHDQKPIVAEKKVGRNDPCPCGSGKKYKKCCL